MKNYLFKFILSVTLIFEISRSKVRVIEIVLKFIFILSLITFNILIFTLLFHPNLGCFLILLIASLGGVFISLEGRKWLSYILILIFVGGIIILFLYICRIINSIKSYLHLIIGIIFIIFLYNLIKIIIREKLNGDFNSYLSVIFMNIERINLFILTIYLLLILLVVVKSSKKNIGAIKSKFNE
jgi:hypothetical protein